MSGLDIFEELRYIIELLLAEYMFAYYFAKKKKGFGSFMAAGEVLLCIISVFYIFIRQTVAAYGNGLITSIVSCVWYIGLLFLSMFFIKVCFHLSFLAPGGRVCYHNMRCEKTQEVFHDFLDP